MAESIDTVLDRAERAVATGDGLAGTGFWSAVGRARRDPQLAERYADRIAQIDRRAFERGVRLRIPGPIGLLGLSVLSGAGFVLLAVAARYEGLVHMVMFGAATGALVIGTHSLTHWIVGRSVGIRFTHVFLGGPPPPRPGLKTDYASYLRVSPRKRALMHASGAVVTKIVPFALVPVALAQDALPVVVWILIAAGLLQIVTDAVFSTKTSDWKKVRRELRAAR